MTSGQVKQGWKNMKIGDLCRVKHGYAFKGEFFSSKGQYIVLTPGNFNEKGGFKLRGSKDRFYKGEFSEQYILNKQDVIIAMTEQKEGLLGSAAIIPQNNKFLHNQRLGLLIDLSDVDKIFLYYLFNTRGIRQLIAASASGTKVRHTSPERLYEIKTCIPPLKTQQKIASILSAFDDLIESNTKRIKLLESTAQLIYKAWFVDFKFPGHEKVKIVDSGTEFGEVPEGWEVGKLTDLASITMGQSPKSEFYNEDNTGKPFHQGVASFGYRFPKHEKFCTADKVRLANKGDILFSVRAPVGRINIAPSELVIGRGLAAIRSKSNAQSFLLYHLQNSFFKEDMIGGGAIFASVTKNDLRSFAVLDPAVNLVGKFEANISSTDKEIEVLILQNINLRKIRDLLLPKLVGGTIELTN